MPQEQHASSVVDGDFVIIEKFVSFPIVLTWIKPINFWGQPIFSFMSLGGYVRYLLSSKYVADPDAKNLPLGKAGEVVDLKNYIKDINFFSYGVILFELGLLLPIGLYVNFVGTVPGEVIAFLFSSKDKFRQDISKRNNQINAAYIQESRRSIYDNGQGYLMKYPGRSNIFS